MDATTERRHIEEINACIASSLRLIDRMNLCIATAEVHGFNASNARGAVQLMRENVAALVVTRYNAESKLCAVVRRGWKR